MNNYLFMAETNVATPPAEGKTPGNIVSAGIPTRLEVAIPSAAAPVVDDNNDGGNNTPATPAANPPETPVTTDAPPATIPEDQLKAFFESQGIAFEGIDKLKEKLAGTPATPPTTELTDEQKEQIKVEKEKRLIDAHLSNKGTVEQFTSFKNIIAGDKKELGLRKEIEDLVAAGIPQEEATQLANERYFQLTDEQIAAIDDETLRAKAVKQKEIGSKKLENKGAYIQKFAESYLTTLEKGLAEKDAEKTKMEQHSSTVEDAIKKYSRKQTLNLGQNPEGQDIAPIDFEFSETALNSAKEVLIDAAKLDANLFTNDGGVNLDFILPYIVKANSLEEAVKKTYLTATDRAIETMKSTFSSTVPSLGKQNNGKGRAGVLTGAGQPEVFRPAVKK